MAKLYIICGNCGRNDFELCLTRDGDDVSINEEMYEDSASMICMNCHTIHDLKDNAKKITITMQPNRADETEE